MENIHRITNHGTYTLRVVITDWDGEERHADYTDFRLENEVDKYRLRYGSFIGGSAGDSLTFEGETANNQPFSTQDRDNDNFIGKNCASVEGGGWWFSDHKNCDRANPNGIYHHDGSLSEGIEWDSWKNFYSFKGTTMMVKEN